MASCRPANPFPFVDACVDFFLFLKASCDASFDRIIEGVSHEAFLYPDDSNNLRVNW